MTSDSKFGLVSGIAAVLAVAVVYHNKPALGDAVPAQAVTGSAAAPPGTPPAAVGVPLPADGMPIRAEVRPAGTNRPL